MILSIIIPVYNEEQTINSVLDSVIGLEFNSVKKEIVVIDDCSSDSTSSIIKSFLKLNKEIKYLKHKRNTGKGAAVKSGIKISTGDYLLVQDADLEYNPNDIHLLLGPIIRGEASIVFGTRLKRLPNFFRDEKTLQFFLHYLGNKILSLMVSVLYRQWITDVETGYKLIPRSLMKQLNLQSNGFEIEPEITIKIIKSGLHIHEVPIQTNPRGYADGKKLRTIQDGYKALLTIVANRFAK